MGWLDWLALANVNIAVSVFCNMLNGCFCLVSPQILVFQSLESSIGLAVMVSLSVSPRQNSLSRSTKDYVLVYAQSTLAEQSTPAYIAIIDSDMPVTNIIWVGEDWLLGVGWTAFKKKPDVRHMCVRYILETPEGFHRSWPERLGLWLLHGRCSIMGCGAV